MAKRKQQRSPRISFDRFQFLTILLGSFFIVLLIGAVFFLRSR